MLFETAIAAGLKVLDKFIPDPEARAKAEAELRDSLQAWDRAQMAVNQAEAGHASIFVAGWRPFIGWVCGASLAYQFVVLPFASWALAMWAPGTPPLPGLNDMLFELTMAMLGMGGLRTFEKLKGVARKSM